MQPQTAAEPVTAPEAQGRLTLRAGPGPTNRSAMAVMTPAGRRKVLGVLHSAGLRASGRMFRDAEPEVQAHPSPREARPRARRAVKAPSGDDSPGSPPPPHVRTEAAFKLGESLGLTPPQRLVLVALAHHEGTSRGAFPSQETLARETGYKVRHVRNLLRSLRDLGALTSEERRGRATVYRMAGTPAPQCRGDGPTTPAPQALPQGADPGTPVPGTPAPQCRGNGKEGEGEVPKALPPDPFTTTSDGASSDGGGAASSAPTPENGNGATKPAASVPADPSLNARRGNGNGAGREECGHEPSDLDLWHLAPEDADRVAAYHERFQARRRDYERDGFEFAPGDEPASPPEAWLDLHPDFRWRLEGTAA